MSAQTAVWTGHYDNFRTGANTSETILTPANVNAAHFGKLARLRVTGCVFAQPLYVPGVATATRGARNLVFIATATNMVYAYDADDYRLEWNANFGTPVPSTMIAPGQGYYDFLDCDPGENNGGNGPIGIVGTPVIDVAAGAMYFVASTLDAAGKFHDILHKVRLGDGTDLATPADIAGSYQNIQFDARYHLQRTALLLLNGRIYIPFASHHDETPYYGWMFAYDSTLTQVAAMNYSPNAWGTGIWQSGGGPATDGKYIYFTTGNDAEDVATASANSESILQVDPVTLQVVAKTSFFPDEDDWDWNFDLDLGAGRVVIMPGTNHLVTGSKFGDLFYVNQTGMMLEVRQQAAARHSSGLDWTGVYNGLAYWNKTIYAWPGGGGLQYGPAAPFPVDYLKAFAITPDGEGMNVLSYGESEGTGAGYQGGNIAISANGNNTATGIVWASTPLLSTIGLQPGALHAYSASDFSGGIFHELWNNTGDAFDSGCNLAKFNQPLIANGKVFLATFSDRVLVYGLLPPLIPEPNSPRGHFPRSAPKPSASPNCLPISFPQQ
jgi:hypothetical protein